jgi:hypothetical protein
MDIKELQLFSSPVWSVENSIAEDDLKKLVEFSYAAVERWPIDRPVSKRHGFNSQPLSFNNPILTNILSKSIQAVKSVYQPSVEISLEKYWININPPGAYNIRHTHPRSVLTCTLYLQTPVDSGDLVVYNMNAAQVFAAYSVKSAQYNFTEYRIKPRPGLFVAFPGWLDHSVDENNSSGDRISISMNIVTHE